MEPEKLRAWIDSLTDDIEFTYKGIDGAICPISREQIYLSYGDSTYDAVSVNDAMQYKLFGGKALIEMSNQISIN